MGQQPLRIDYNISVRDEGSLFFYGLTHDLLY